MRRGFFVTGTDTGVGKTIASAALVHLLRDASAADGSSGVRYWKPIQTGVEQDDDTAEVARLGGCTPAEILTRGIRLPRPLSPHLSARLAGQAISIEDAMRAGTPDIADGTWIVEGAGGVLVPLNDSEMMIDFMVRLALPVVVVTRTTLGTINHTLLTIEALRARRLKIAGVILNGEANPENREAIERYGRVRTLGELRPLATLTAASLAAWARSNISLAEAR